MKSNIQKRYLSLAIIMLLCCPSALAQHHHETDSSHHSRLHFSHPLIAESPSPDTKVRIDYAHERFAENAPSKSNLIALEAEYAFRPGFSVEINLPYVFLDPAASNLGDIEIGLKFATFAFAEHGMLLGGGVELGLPTGNKEKNIGGNHFEIEPFVSVAYQHDRFEAVAFVHVGIPTSQEKDRPFETELVSNVSLLYALRPGFEILLEYDGLSTLTGEENEVIAHLAPGVKVRPLSSAPSLMIGIGHRIPITTHKEFESHTSVSLFYHF